MPDGSTGDVYDDRFRIDDNGFITTITDVLKGEENLNITVIGSDDTTSLEGYGFVLIQFMGVNSPPRFTECSSYAPTVPEHEPAGYMVLQVRFFFCNSISWIST